MPAVEHASAETDVDNADGEDCRQTAVPCAHHVAIVGAKADHDRGRQTAVQPQSPAEAALEDGRLSLRRVQPPPVHGAHAADALHSAQEEVSRDGTREGVQEVDAGEGNRGREPPPTIFFFHAYISCQDTIPEEVVLCVWGGGGGAAEIRVICQRAVVLQRVTMITLICCFFQTKTSAPRGRV